MWLVRYEMNQKNFQTTYLPSLRRSVGIPCRLHSKCWKSLYRWLFQLLKINSKSQLYLNVTFLQYHIYCLGESEREQFLDIVFISWRPAFLLRHFQAARRKSSWLSKIGSNSWMLYLYCSWSKTKEDFWLGNFQIS